VSLLEEVAGRAKRERGSHWAYGSDELYLVAGLPLPPPDRYDGFEQLENGVGSVRYLQERVAGLRAELAGSRIGVFTGSAMGRLMPQVLSHVGAATGAECDLIVLENDLFGASVTTAGLVPGRAFVDALRDREDLDLALIPAESVNEDGHFIDDVTAEQLSEAAPTEVRFSYDFRDVLSREAEE
jgi:NifB/MoaA-like Fe-S oxidoreductase